MGLLGWSFVLASWSCALSVAAVWSCYRVLKRLQQPSALSLAELSAHVTAMQSAFESLSMTVRRLASKYGMRDLRAKAPTLDELPTDEWRRAARAKYIKPGQAVQHSE